jgi:signal transduction histidine kinase
MRLDQPKFKQICYNLLSNAVKFTDSAGRVDIHALASGEDRFEVRVSDGGIGIRPEDIPRLFREFEQLDSGSSRQFEGTGLGLALTKKLVEAQGGVIKVESVYGRGSVFSFCMPRVLPEACSS